MISIRFLLHKVCTTSHPRAVGRIVRILDQISPDTINTFELTNMNAENSMYSMTIDRNEFNKYKNQKAASPLLYSTEIKKIHSNQIERDHEFKPTKSFPLHFWKIAPQLEVKSEVLMGSILVKSAKDYILIF